MGTSRARRPADLLTEETPAPLATPTPTAALGWETRVELRLDRLETAVEGMRGDLDERMDRLYALLERPTLHERCMAGLGELAAKTVDRLTEPAAIKWTAVVILGLVALLTGASLSGWGVTIGGNVDLKQPPTRTHASPATER